jgi:hypothetical protein
VAVVYLGDGNVNAWMVEQGHAWAYREYLKDRTYCTWEHDARSASRGLWGLPQSQQVAPWEWRRVQRGDLDMVSDYSGETIEGCVAAIGKDGARRRASNRPQPPAGASSGSGGCQIKGNIS